MVTCAFSYVSTRSVSDRRFSASAVDRCGRSSSWSMTASAWFTCGEARIETSGKARTRVRYPSLVVESKIAAIATLSVPVAADLRLPGALVVLGMCEQVFDIDDAQIVADVYNQPIRIAFDIEHRLVTHRVGVGERPAYLTEVVPGGLVCDGVPSSHLTNTVAMCGC